MFVKGYATVSFFSLPGLAWEPDEMNQTYVAVNGVPTEFNGVVSLPEIKVGDRVVLEIPSGTLKMTVDRMPEIVNPAGVWLYRLSGPGNWDGKYDGMRNGYSGLGEFNLDIAPEAIVASSIGSCTWLQYQTVRQAVMAITYGEFGLDPELNQEYMRAVLRALKRTFLLRDADGKIRRCKDHPLLRKPGALQKALPEYNNFEVVRRVLASGAAYPEVLVRAFRFCYATWTEGWLVRVDGRWMLAPQARPPYPIPFLPGKTGWEVAADGTTCGQQVVGYSVVQAIGPEPGYYLSTLKAATPGSGEEVTLTPVSSVEEGREAGRRFLREAPDHDWETGGGFLRFCRRCGFEATREDVDVQGEEPYVPASGDDDIVIIDDEEV